MCPPVWLWLCSILHAWVPRGTGAADHAALREVQLCQEDLILVQVTELRRGHLRPRPARACVPTGCTSAYGSRHVGATRSASVAAGRPLQGATATRRYVLGFGVVPAVPVNGLPADQAGLRVVQQQGDLVVEVALSQTRRRRERPRGLRRRSRCPGFGCCSYRDGRDPGAQGSAPVDGRQPTFARCRCCHRWSRRRTARTKRRMRLDQYALDRLVKEPLRISKDHDDRHERVSTGAHGNQGGRTPTRAGRD